VSSNDFYGGRNFWFGKGNNPIKRLRRFEINRYSILHLSGRVEAEQFDIFVGGEVQSIAKCNLV
jgi:hypothetical protein